MIPLGNTPPDLLALHAALPARYPFLLQSVAHGPQQARYDILFAFPGATLTLHANGVLQRDGATLSTHDFLQQLDLWWQAEAMASASPSALPFHGGWFVYLSYELARQIEPTLCLPRAAEGLPAACATRIPAALIHDHATGITHAVAEPGHEALLAQMQADVATAPPFAAAGALLTAWTEDDPAQYLSGVARIKDYILAGDVFQVNLSRAWRAQLAAHVATATIYARLRHSNPAPFAGLASYSDAAIISSSPERLVQVRDGMVETRPIAGTRPRGHGIDDQAQSRELLAHPKERAEHVMLIDLERNDLGRVCVPGTMAVNELMVLESYAHVHHIVSNVRGQLRAGVTPGEVIRAVFPGGTITGCPKVRCMEIIAELEDVARGPYTGSMGYLNRDGSMDLNILIRSLHRAGDQLTWRAGAGIVADSVPALELAEARAKARGLLLALGITD